MGSSLGRYPSEVHGIADELLSILRQSCRAEAANELQASGIRLFTAMTNEECEAALKLLEQSPSQREKTLARRDARSATKLVLQARFLGLAAAQALHFADRMEMVPGMGYRRAASFAAQQVLRARFSATLEEVFPDWKPGYGSRLSNSLDDEDWSFSDR